MTTISAMRAAELWRWVRVKRQRGVYAAHVQTARELEMNPRQRRREKRQAELDHLEAMRISMLTLRRVRGSVEADDDHSGRPSTG
jgi:hypothetical protein